MKFKTMIHNQAQSFYVVYLSLCDGACGVCRSRSIFVPAATNSPQPPGFANTIHAIKIPLILASLPLNDRFHLPK